MKIKKENFGLFINAAFWIFALFTDPIWILINQMGPVSLMLPAMFGVALAKFEENIDWKLMTW